MIIAGIDYSMSSPAICIHQGDEWSFSNCSFYYLTNKKKFATPKHPFYPTIHGITSRVAETDFVDEDALANQERLLKLLEGK